MKLDFADRIILRAVQQDCRLGAEALGEMAGVSPSTAQRRLNRLREEGVITGEFATVSAKAVGRPLLLIASVTLQNEDSRAGDEFVRTIRANPAVMQCYFVTGSADYVILYSAKNMEEYDEFVKSFLLDNPYVCGSSTNVVVRSVKTGLAVPIDDE